MTEASESHAVCADTPNFTHLQHSSHCEGDCGIGNGLVISKDDGLTWYNFFYSGKQAAPTRRVCTLLSTVCRSQPKDLSAEFGAASGSLVCPQTVRSSGPN